LIGTRTIRIGSRLGYGLTIPIMTPVWVSLLVETSATPNQPPSCSDLAQQNQDQKDDYHKA
jgi:hypothetical protein